MYMIYDMIYVDRYASHYAYTKYFWVMMKFFFGMHIQQGCFRTFRNHVPGQRSQAQEDERNWIQRKLDLETACKEPFLLFHALWIQGLFEIGCSKDF